MPFRQSCSTAIHVVSQIITNRWVIVPEETDVILRFSSAVLCDSLMGVLNPHCSSEV